MGRNGSGGVLIMSVSATVPEKLRGNKKRDEDSFARWRNYSQKNDFAAKKSRENQTCDEDEEERHIFGPLALLKNGRDMVVCNSFDIYMFTLSRTAR